MQRTAEPEVRRGTATELNGSPPLVPLTWHDDARVLLDVHRCVLLVGPPGSGKTHFVRAESRRRAGREPETLQGTPETEISHLWGSLGLNEQGTTFREGPLPRALDAGCPLVIEEFSLVPLDVRAALLALRGATTITHPFTGRSLDVPHAFRLLATSQPETFRCVGDDGLAHSLLDDFLTLDVPALGTPQVHAMLQAEHPDADPTLIERTITRWDEYRQFAHQHRANAGSLLSIRAAQHLFLLLQAGMRESMAVEVALIQKFVVDAELLEAARLKSSFDDVG